MRFDRHPTVFPSVPRPTADRGRPRGALPFALRAPLLAVLLPFLLGACGGSPEAAPLPDRNDPAPAIDVEARPDAVAHVAAAHDGVRLLEGARRVEGQLYPDGRVYLEAADGRTLLLTPPRDFGDAFFAHALALLPDPAVDGGTAALIQVARSGDTRLYRVAPGAAPRPLFGLAELGGAQPVQGTVAVDAAGRTVAFVAFGPVTASWAGPPGAREGYTLEPSVWRFDTAVADPAATLERVMDGAELVRRGYDPAGAPPRLAVGVRGRIAVATRTP